MNPKPRKLDRLQFCFVPTCKNTVLMCPNKHFFYVPKSTRVQWCAAVNKQKVPKYEAYICEDHLNLQEDLLNYNEWVCGKVVRPRLKPLPSILRNIGSTSIKSPQPSTSTATSLTEDQSDYFQEKGTLCIPECYSKSVQVQPVMLDKSVSVRKHLKQNAEKAIHVEQKQKVIEGNYSEEPNLSSIGSTIEFTETESSSLQPVEKELDGRNFILKLIENNPLAYIGIAKKHYWIIEHLGEKFRIPALNILITLYKIKNNDTFVRIKDLFQVSISTVWRIFYNTLKLLSLFFKQFIYWPTPYDIMRNLPWVFTTCKENASVQSIIDCFEVEIEKPKSPIEQSLTWSEYKHCNTLKYLIGATPDGFINFISEGYGGRISDINLIEQSGFLETVPANATILADRGFKHLESHLIKKSVKVLRPPSVTKDTKMTKSEVIDSKVLASLRINIERVIRRVRLFKLLKPHSVVNNKLVNVLDDAVIVALGLINLQSSIIKK